VDSARISLNSYNAYKLQGKDTVALDLRYVNENQANSISSTMITDGTITRSDVSPIFKAPYADTADYTRNVNIVYVDSARISASSHKLQGKDTVALSAKFVDEGQANAISNTMIIDNAITTTKIQDNTITRNDVVTNFKSPYADTADFARTANVQYVDSARVSVNAHNAYKLQGKDTIALDSRYVNEGQVNSITNTMITSNAITSDKIQDGTITRSDVASNFKAPLADTADYARVIPGVIDSARVAANAHRLQGKDTSDFDSRFVNESQANAITTDMLQNQVVTNAKLAPNSVSTDKIVNGTIGTIDLEDEAITADKIERDAVRNYHIMDGTITRSDVASNFKAPYADTADYVRNLTVNYVDSARVAVNAYNARKLQGKDTTDFDARFVNEGQTNSITTTMIVDNAITSQKIQDGTIQITDLSFTPATRPFSPLISGTEIAKPCTLDANVAQYDAVLNVKNTGNGYAIKANSNSDAIVVDNAGGAGCLLYTSPSPR
ncbi:MAG: hypothetical protein N2748_05785, partial [candidate division WOR-3 bacterium]|nr:hypothetical protein [candidate division WOR-3 bacterium]